MADTYAQEFNDLAGLFSKEWGITTSVAWPNVSFEPKAGVPWVRFNVLTGESQQASIGSPGSNYFRYTGVIDVQVFTPTGTGTPTSLGLADKVIEIFHKAELPGYRFSAGYVAGGSSSFGVIVENSSSSSGWRQCNVRIPYRRDSLK